MEISLLLKALKKRRYNLENEKQLQENMFLHLTSDLPKSTVIRREFFLSSINIIDFLINDEIGIEVKIRGQKKAIYKQCERYCEFDKIKVLILVTNKSMGFPPQINGKDCYVVNLGKSWL